MKGIEDYTMESNETLIMPARGWRRTHKRTNFGLENRQENDKKKKKKNLPIGFKTSIEGITVEMTYVVGATWLIKREM